MVHICTSSRRSWPLSSSLCILLYNIMLGRHLGRCNKEAKKELVGLSYAQDQLHSAVVQQTTRLVAPLTAAGARTLQFLSGIASSLAWEDSNHGTRDPKGEGRTAVHQGDSSGAPQYSSALHPHAGDKPLHSARHEQCSCTALTPSIEVRIIITCRRLKVVRWGFGRF